MAIDNFGRWTPDMMQNVQPLQGASVPQYRQAMSAAQPALPTAQRPPQQMIAQNIRPVDQSIQQQSQQFVPQTMQAISQPQSAQFAANISSPQQSQQQMPQQFLSQPNYGQYLQQQQYQAPQRQLSVEQGVNNNSPQSVQNFLGALHQTGAGNNNNFMNAPGQQGQGPQAGFQGFQQNGQQPYQNMQQNWQGYGGQNSGQLGSYSNQASYGQNYGGGGQSTQSITQGGTGGQNTQPQYYQNGVATSDQNAKTDIAPANNELQDFLNSLGVYSYEYKDKQYGEGRRISPMAQEIESTPLGQVAISTNAQGYKQVDYGKLGGTTLAATAYNHQRISSLEDKLAKFKQDILKDMKSNRKDK